MSQLRVFLDTLRPAALLDRRLHHAHIVPIAGESYRLKHSRQAGMVQVRKGADACAVKGSSLPGKSVLPAAANLAPYPDRWRGGAAVGGHALAESNGKPGGRRSDCKREERRT